MYGTLFHIRNKNPFNLEVLVDAWPEYQTVVIRPQKEVRPWLLRVRPLTLRTGMRGCSEGPAGRGVGGRILTHLIMQIWEGLLGGEGRMVSQSAGVDHRANSPGPGSCSRDSQLSPVKTRMRGIHLNLDACGCKWSGNVLLSL